MVSLPDTTIEAHHDLSSDLSRKHSVSPVSVIVYLKGYYPQQKAACDLSQDLCQISPLVDVMIPQNDEEFLLLLRPYASVTPSQRDRFVMIITDDRSLHMTQKLSAVHMEMIWVSWADDFSDIPSCWFGDDEPSFVLKHLVAGHHCVADLHHELKVVVSELITYSIHSHSWPTSARPAPLVSSLVSSSKQSLGEAVVSSTTEMISVSQKIKTTALHLGLSELWAAKIYGVARELISNAHYDAVSAAGCDDYGVISKKYPLTLKPPHASEVRWSRELGGKQNFWIEVIDPFGVLQPRCFNRHLAKVRLVGQRDQSIEHKQQHGAGLGLFQVFLASSAIRVYQNPHVSTSVCALFYPYQHKPTFHKRARSFHFFITHPQL